jgi:ribosome recycling factor
MLLSRPQTPLSESANISTPDGSTASTRQVLFAVHHTPQKHVTRIVQDSCIPLEASRAGGSLRLVQDPEQAELRRVQELE